MAVGSKCRLSDLAPPGQNDNTSYIEQRQQSVPPHAGEVRFQISEGTELDPAIEKVRSLVNTDPRVLADPAPSVLLDHSAAENALEVVVAFATGEDVAPVVKSDLIKAAHAVLDTPTSKPAVR